MVREFFTSRADGNLALHVGDDPEVVSRNRATLASRLALPENSVKYMNQVHGNHVEVVDKNSQIVTADALFTRERDIALVVLVADCIPILLHSKSAIAAAHVGRQGLIKGILNNVVNHFHQLGEREIHATIGPAICASCYEVAPEMYREIVADFPACATNEKLHSLDLLAGAQAQLKSHNVTMKTLNKCTRENSDLYSHRADSKAGRFAGVISW